MNCQPVPVLHSLNAAACRSAGVGRNPEKAFTHPPEIFSGAPQCGYTIFNALLFVLQGLKFCLFLLYELFGGLLKTGGFYLNIKYLHVGARRACADAFIDQEDGHVIEKYIICTRGQFSAVCHSGNKSAIMIYHDTVYFRFGCQCLFLLRARIRSAALSGE
jgi:hypothetical protein